MGREIWVRREVWRSLRVWNRRSVSLVRASLRSCVIDFSFSSLVLGYLIVVRQNDTQSFLHQSVPNFYCNAGHLVVVELE